MRVLVDIAEVWATLLVVLLLVGAIVDEEEATMRTKQPFSRKFHFCGSRTLSRVRFVVTKAKRGNEKS